MPPLDDRVPPRASGGAAVRRGYEPDNEEFDETLNRGWHEYMTGARTGDQSADTRMRSKPGDTADDMEISTGKFSKLGGRRDWDPEPQGLADGGTAEQLDTLDNIPGVPMRNAQAVATLPMAPTEDQAPLPPVQRDPAVAQPAPAKPAITLDSIRQKYPQYSDLSDQQLAQGLHRKFYDDMPFEEFAGRIGYQQQPGLLQRAGRAIGRAATAAMPSGESITAPVGRVLNTARDTFGDEPLGLSEKTAAALQRAGVFPDPNGGLQPLRELNEAIVRPVAAMADAFVRAGSAGFTAAQQAAMEAGRAAGLTDMQARTIASMPEAFLGDPGMIPHYPREYARTAEDLRNEALNPEGMINRDWEGNREPWHDYQPPPLALPAPEGKRAAPGSGAPTPQEDSSVPRPEAAAPPATEKPAAPQGPQRWEDVALQELEPHEQTETAKGAVKDFAEAARSEGVELPTVTVTAHPTAPTEAPQAPTTPEAVAEPPAPAAAPEAAPVIAPPQTAAPEAPDYNALYDEAQAIMRKLPTNIGKARQEGRLSQNQLASLDRLDAIEQVMPTTGPEWQRIWTERRTAYDAQRAQTAAQVAEDQRTKLQEAGFAEGDKVFFNAPSMLPHVPGTRHEGTVRIGKDGTAYVASGGKQLDPFANPWMKAETAAEPPQAPAEQLAPPAETPENPAKSPEINQTEAENAPQTDYGKAVVAAAQRAPEHAIADKVAYWLDQPTADGVQAFSARQLQDYAGLAYGKKLSEGLQRDVLYDAQELGVNRYVQSHPDQFDPRADAVGAIRAAEDLAAQKDRLPTQTVRAGEKDTHQQFSTPPDYSYAAAWVANLRPEDRVIEPSAGTGSLAVMAKNAGVAEVVGNELSEKRRGMLAHLGLDRITAEDARQLHNALPADIKPSVVLMNPPFSAAPGRMGNKMVLGEGAAHVKAALDRLQPGGRLVAIVGRGMTMDAPAFRDWWKAIGTQYDVRANVGVVGGIYRKYGTNFGTRLLVIDKIPPGHQPIVGGEVPDARSLIEKLQGIRDDRPVQPMAGQPSGAALAPPGEAPGGREPELSAPTGPVGAGAGSSPLAEQPQPSQPGRAGTRGRPQAPVRQPGSDAGNALAPVGGGRPDGGAGGEPRAPVEAGDLPTPGGRAGGGDGVRADGSGERDEPGVTEAAPITIAAETAVTKPDATELTEAVYESYKPQRLKIPGAKEHPGALVQSAAMASVLPPEPKYAPRLPKALVQNGGLSNAQLEAVAYAGQAHEQTLPDGSRRGFFIGDGTGVGKGREIGGIILDNFNQGRTKAVWISEKPKLFNDAKRDWTGIGQPATDLMMQGKVKAGDAIKSKRGILFTTYATLRNGERIKAEAKPDEVEDANRPKFAKGKSRIDQIAEWFGPDYDGAIVFDEAHNLGNAMDTKGKRGVKQASQMALAGLELQKKLPNARVVYVSATGATEVNNLAYAERLGLWGEGTAFPNRNAFLSQVSSGGVAAMELVARDMKALGHYIARNLSYDGVEYDRLEHKLTPDQRQIYDKLAEGWQVVLQNFQAALAQTGGDKNSGAKTAALSAFWGGHQRFFNQVITSLQMPAVLKAVEKDIKSGKQAVLQLVNTNEASQERALEKADPEDLEDLDMTPRDQLMQLVEKSFPTQEYEEYVDDSGNTRSRPVTDSDGNPVHNKAMLEARDRLLDQLGSIRVPDGPLELLLNHFGTEQVAEVTGRKQRVVRKADENGNPRTVVEKRPGSSNEAETNAFQAGKKKVLVFSAAGGTGASYHADNTAASKNARRSHYLVQAGWRADQAVQGFGRTHRTNQASAPIFHLVTTDLQGQRRFISSIARRLGQLGALTKGERRTGDQGLFGMKDNLESALATNALHQLFRDIHSEPEGVNGITMEALEKGMGLKLRDENGALRSDLPGMTQFLNRLLSLQIDGQNRTFEAFSERFNDAIERAAAAGTLDTGVETYKADKISKKSDQTVYTDPNSGAATRHVHLEVNNRNHPTTFDKVYDGYKDRGFVQNNRSGRVYAVTDATSYTDPKSGQIIDQYRLTSPISYQFIDKQRVTGDNWTKLDTGTARGLWDRDVKNTPEFSKSDLHLITGAVLPIWDRLGGSPRVMRLQTDAGERMLGRVVPNKTIGATLERLGAGQVKIDAQPAEIAQRILQGDRAQLANGWTIARAYVAGEPRLELKGPDYRYDDELERAGVFKERIAYQTRYFIPTGEAAGPAIQAVTKGRPVVSFGEKPGADIYGSDTHEMYSFPAMLFDPKLWRKALGLEVAKPAYEILRDQKGIAGAVAGIKAGFAPTALRGAKPMEYALRQHNANIAQSYDQAVHALEKVRRATDTLSKEAQIAFFHAMETGESQPTPGLQAVADALRGQLDKEMRATQALGKGYLANAIENYMGHIWGNYHEWAAKQESEATQGQMEQIARAMTGAKRPLEGKASFLKKRYFPTQLEGIEAGLIPVTYNPVDLQLIKIYEMQKFRHAVTLAEQMKAQGIARWVKNNPGDEADARIAGLVKLDDKIFQPKFFSEAIQTPSRGIGDNGGPDANTMPGWVQPGSYWAPEPMARVFNNFMSQGWHGKSSLYDGFRAMNNGLNALQLGLSGFHAMFVGLDTAISKSALGLQQMSRGHFLRGAASMAETPIAPITTFLKGKAATKAWLEPENATPEMRKIIDAMKAGGARLSMPEFYRTSASGSFFRHVSDLKHPQSVFHQVAQMWRDTPGPVAKAIMVPTRAVFRALDTIQHPLMGFLVPRMKMGVFADLAQDWLRDHPTASAEEVSAAMTRFQDSVDNRLGQLNYDNLFWDKRLKDTAFITERSVGWNLGTLREIGGAAPDSAAFFRDVAEGKRPEVTTRIAYSIMLPIIVGLAGAIITYLATGEGPKHTDQDLWGGVPLDLFYPRTGGTTPNGEPERLSIPSYMKDVVAAIKDPIQTVRNKIAPLWATLDELVVQNKDYYGGSIYDPERDSSRVGAYADYLLNQIAPFSVRAKNRLADEEASWEQQALGFFGWQPAPKSITNPERGEAFQRRANTKAYRQRLKEPGRIQFFNAPRAP